MIKTIVSKADIYANISLSNNYFSIVTRVYKFVEYYILYDSI